MRILVISDIHANVTALEAVLADVDNLDAIWCLGDLVGYGPDPNQVIELLRQQANLTCILGNHDVAVLGKMDSVVFNSDARKSLFWHQKTISAENKDFLEQLSLIHKSNKLVLEHVTLVHGSPRDPVWEYIINTLAARLNFSEFETPFCFVGHTHLPGMFELDLEKDRVTQYLFRAGQELKLTPKAILNPGSVGQPRDHDPRASYAIFDPGTLTWEPRRVSYDISSVQARIRAADLPEKHALRLAEGW